MIRVGDALDRLREIPDGSVHCCITSPPYFGLRDYGQEGQIGLEATPDEYVARLVGVFGEVKRVLRDDGTLWLNLGDSYAGSWGAQSRGARDESSTLTGSPLSGRQIHAHPKGSKTGTIPVGASFKAKDLLGIPWMVAFALRADGWYLRSEIIWAKRNCMPESVTDRPTKSHEQVFLLSKSPRYFFDGEAIREGDAGADHARNIREEPSLEPSGGLRNGHGGIRTTGGRNGSGRNKRSVWTVATQPYPEAHFATFPPKLIEPMVLAGCPRQTCGTCGAPWERVVEREGSWARRKENGARGGDGNTRSRASGATHVHGVGMSHDLSASAVTIGWQATCDHDDGSGSGLVLDPFAGSGTTLQVAEANGRQAIGIELNPQYAALAERRLCGVTPSMFDVAEAT